ncbi:glycosyl transferase [Desulfosporosinus acidiphilus SJ4]|uniref:Glycosyl transferase n=1 Tax=Desulfosporosinus acidiphilus (strain DSM 22704 / JCM 16185 / SJ4) TaxID=646529 RepID=I4DBT0_DESAJ|nr:glycosyltransferase family 2 protein [Desulfosporosinus acidiphilus]AFM43254.1 glycosyl transferase [Desulfosporosinus acidiphilus SJ4]
MKKLISIVIPIYNEAEHLKDSIILIVNQVNNLGIPFELIFIDDGSKDASWNIIMELHTIIPQIRAYRLSRNFGKEQALCAGLEKAEGDGVIIMDADLQHPPKLIKDMIEAWKCGAEIVECIKVSRGDEPYINKIGSRLFYAMLKLFSGYSLNGASDYKLMDRKVVNEWKKMDERNVFFRGMAAWLGFRVEKIPFSVDKRAGGKSTWSVKNLVKLGIKAIVSFSTIPLRIVSVLGVSFLLAAILMIIQTLYMKFSGNAVTGFTTVIVLLLIIGSVLMISLGVIGEYIAAIYNEVKHRPRFIISEGTEKKSEIKS